MIHFKIKHLLNDYLVSFLNSIFTHAFAFSYLILLSNSHDLFTKLFIELLLKTKQHNFV